MDGADPSTRTSLAEGQGISSGCSAAAANAGKHHPATLQPGSLLPEPAASRGIKVHLYHLTPKPKSRIRP